MNLYFLGVSSTYKAEIVLKLFLFTIPYIFISPSMLSRISTIFLELCRKAEPSRGEPARQCWQPKMQFAVLIDAENVSARYVQVIFDELEKYGFASCRRIYDNWSKESGWKENILLEY